MKTEEQIVVLGYSPNMISMLLDNLNSNNYNLELIVINNELKPITQVEDVFHPKIKVIAKDLNSPDAIQDFFKNPNYRPFLGVYRTPSKVKLHHIYQALLYNSPNIIHSNTDISLSTSIGFGNLINTAVVIAGHTRIGNFCSINRTSSIGHHSKIGDFCTINPGVTICGGITIEENVTVGAKATIIDGLTIGANSIIGAGSVVVKDVPPNSVVMGIPGKVVNQNTPITKEEIN